MATRRLLRLTSQTRRENTPAHTMSMMARSLVTWMRLLSILTARMKKVLSHSFRRKRSQTLSLTRLRRLQQSSRRSILWPRMRLWRLTWTICPRIWLLIIWTVRWRMICIVLSMKASLPRPEGRRLNQRLRLLKRNHLLTLWKESRMQQKDSRRRRKLRLRQRRSLSRRLTMQQ